MAAIDIRIRSIVEADGQEHLRSAAGELAQIPKAPTSHLEEALDTMMEDKALQCRGRHVVFTEDDRSVR
jgi:hypothetical protein